MDLEYVEGYAFQYAAVTMIADRSTLRSPMTGTSWAKGVCKFVMIDFPNARFRWIRDS
jgi:hypothetical protein